MIFYDIQYTRISEYQTIKTGKEDNYSVFKIAICDDEDFFRKWIKEMLQKYMRENGWTGNRTKNSGTEYENLYCFC